MGKDSVDKLALGHGFELVCSFPTLHSIDIELRFRRWTLVHGVFDERLQMHEHFLNLGVIRIGVGLESDMFEGVTIWRPQIDWRLPGRPWRRLWGGKDRQLLRSDPCIGTIGGGTAAYPPAVDHPTFGTSQTCTPSILRIHVEEEKRDLCEVGSMVKKVMFPHHPPFVFNTVACVGSFPPGGAGTYTDPESIWFNVFLGYYQLDCQKSDWDRPFGYQAAKGGSSAVETEDLARLGKSDWNWFSNWDYGVPTSAVMPYSKVDMRSITVVDRGLQLIGAKHWHELELGEVEVASSYLAEGGELAENTVIDEVWRASFGGPSPRPEYPTSFIPTVTNAVVDMAYWEDDDAYHTVIFGGTAGADADPEFLAAQIAATKDVIVRYYPDLGFS